ncbi:MAG TPA: AAA family ATPase [Candidatus Baltobacteraceae bacterium]|nr:AAA family ATPase [Candidatus Baltobacteraceae bacterium]
MKNVLSEILRWSSERPGWQRDALRRLLTSETTAQEDVVELADLCKAAHGLSDPRTPQPLTADHLAVQSRKTSAVSLVSVTHHGGVNALAAEQTVTFGPKLTVVYGPNAAGKSGYTRILKRACRSRGLENILGNVLIGEAPLTPRATITFREGSTKDFLAWTQEAAPSAALASVSVFDSHCAPVYLRDKTDVAFRPFGLDIFDKLSTLCGDVRARLEQEQKQLSATASGLPVIPEGTQARALLDGLTALTKVDDVRRLAMLSEGEEHRLNGLRACLRDFQASDPKQRARELSLKAERLNGVVRHLEGLSTVLGDQSVSDLRSAAESVRIAREALALFRTTTFSNNVLPGTGEAAWIGMWEAAGAFSAVAYPGVAFPVTTEDARCPLCQQTIGTEPSERMRHFAEYVTSRAPTEVRIAESRYRAVLENVELANVERGDVTLALEELAVEEPQSAEHVRQFLAEATRIQAQIKTASEGEAEFTARGVGASPADELNAAINALRKRAGDLLAQEPALGAKEATEHKELEARLLLKEHLPVVLEEIERKKRLAAYRQCLDDTSTHALTRKSTELTKELVTDRLRNTFKDELAKLDFHHLLVEVRTAGGAKGSLFHRIEFSNAPGVAVTNVLSEGESRTLSLAAFLTELSTAPSSSAIIFDDPVSSLDHVWRERIAHRLVMEAQDRQVIVFTHDILFMRLLLDGASHQSVQCDHQYVRRDGQPGLCSPNLPWIAMRVKDRIGTLHDLWQTADKLHRIASHEDYERAAREIYGLLREAWEQAVVEILLNDVVERYRPSIQTQKVNDLHDITTDDCRAVDDAMIECSRWFRGHDHAAADGTPLPGPVDLQKRINDLHDWVKTIRQRRK